MENVDPIIRVPKKATCVHESAVCIIPPAFLTATQHIGGPVEDH